MFFGLGKIKKPTIKVVFKKIIENESHVLTAIVTENNEATITVKEYNYNNKGYEIYKKVSILDYNWYDNKISNFEDEVDAIWKKFNE